MCDESKPEKIKQPQIDPFLWRKFKKGDDLAFFTLYDLSFDALYGYGLHFSKDKDLIKDCIHDLFLDLYKYRDRLSDTNNILFYLFRSLRRLIYKEQVRTVSLLRSDQLLLDNDIPVMAFEDNLIDKETEDRNYKILAEVMKELSDGQREGLMLRFEQNFSYKEIAGILGISVESARTNIYRALKDLRKAIKKKGLSLQMILLFFKNKN